MALLDIGKRAGVAAKWMTAPPVDEEDAAKVT